MVDDVRKLLSGIEENGGERYAVPQIPLLEVVSVEASRGTTGAEQVSSAPVYRLRGRLLPLVDLADVLGLEGRRRDRLLNIAVLQSEGRLFGLILDRVLNSEEIVVKPLSRRLKGIGDHDGERGRGADGHHEEDGPQ